MKKRVRRTKEEARRLILDATEELVREHGPNGLRVADVAKRVEMHETNIFHHFGSRSGLLQALVGRAIDAGGTRLLHALGESLGATREGREEAFAKIFDVIQQTGTGRLYGWLLLAGLMNDAQPPDLERLVPAIRAWHAAAFEGRGARPSDDDYRSMTLFIATLWLGEAIGGEVLAQAAGYDDPQAALVKHRRWISRMVFGWLEYEAQQSESA